MTTRSFIGPDQRGVGAAAAGVDRRAKRGGGIGARRNSARGACLGADAPSGASPPTASTKTGLIIAFIRQSIMYSGSNTASTAPAAAVGCAHQAGGTRWR